MDGLGAGRTELRGRRPDPRRRHVVRGAGEARGDRISADPEGRPRHPRLRPEKVKRYDRAYFDKWYRRVRVHSAGELQRKVAMAVSLCEFFLRRRIRNVLDVGCGEGAWFPHLRALRPRVSYLGFDTSDYALERFGSARNIRKGSFADLDVDRRFDLVICSDVLHYLNEREIRSGLPALVRATGGLAFLEVLTSEEDIVGDL